MLLLLLLTILFADKVNIRLTLWSEYQFTLHCHLVSPGNGSVLAAGLWQPGKDELANIRANILRSSAPLRTVLSEQEFVKMFGEPKKHPPLPTKHNPGKKDTGGLSPFPWVCYMLITWGCG